MIAWIVGDGVIETVGILGHETADYIYTEMQNNTDTRSGEKFGLCLSACCSDCIQVLHLPPIGP